MLPDTTVVADSDKGRIDEADAGAASKQAKQLSAQPRENAGHELDEARVTDQIGKLSTEMRLDVLRVKRFEGTVLALVKMDQQGHDFAVTQFACPRSVLCTVNEAFARLFEVSLLTEIIDMAVQFQ